MRSVTSRVHRGWVFGRPKRSGDGWLLNARNSRYVPQDPDSLYTLLGRSKFNASPIGASSNPQADDDVMKAVFPFYVDGGTSKLCVQKGGAIWEADLGLTGSFSEAFLVSTAQMTPHGKPFYYKNDLFLTMGSVLEEQRILLRDSSGWRWAGHRTQAYAFTASPQNPGGGGGFTSSTTVRYTYRIYDSAKDTESAHGPVVEQAAFTDCDSVRLTWASGISLLANELGTHVRIYRTFLSEEPGVYRRVDGTGNGIDLALFTPGYTWDDSTSNIDAAIYGGVRADGVEGTQEWAEHGGPPPKANGGIVFQNHAVVWGVSGEDFRLYYSAQGYPECFPVHFDGSYAYYLDFPQTRQDKIITCVLSGPYLLVLTKSAVYRVSHLPTYVDPGFDRLVKDLVQDEHGVCGEYAADSFGIGDDETGWAIYVSREHGPILTNGIFARPIIRQVDWHGLVDPAYMSNVLVRNYSKMQEVWVFYTPKGGTTNTAALIIDYSMQGSRGLRVTGPVDVKATRSWYATGNDGVQRLYLLNQTDATIYVQDSGTTDTQNNHDASGNVLIEWRTTRSFIRGTNRNSKLTRALVYGSSGAQRAIKGRFRVVDGKDESLHYENVEIGPGETFDAADLHIAGAGFDSYLRYEGVLGSSYDPDDADRAMSLLSIEYELNAAGRQLRTKGT